MSEYEVQYSKEALNDLRDIYYYISVVSQFPLYGKKLVDSIRMKVNSLSDMPLRYKIVEFEPWKSKEVRMVTVKKYNLYYTVDRNRSTVKILRIIYSGRNISLSINKDLK